MVLRKNLSSTLYLANLAFRNFSLKLVYATHVYNHTHQAAAVLYLPRYFWQLCLLVLCSIWSMFMKPCLSRISKGDCSSSGDVKTELLHDCEPLPLSQKHPKVVEQHSHN